MRDILIIGAGGAGLSSALSARYMGADVLVVSKAYPTNSQTTMAQGGINASLGNMDNDSVESHIADTLKSSKGLAREEMITKMCSDAQNSIEWLESIGVPFSRDENSNIAQRRLGGATHKRACYSQDYTGLKILHTLYDNALKEGVEFLNEHYLLSFIKDENRVVGATFWDITRGEVIEIFAKSIIVATGGYSSIYHNFTTNSYGSVGDGISATIKAGGEVSLMEFIQFHPTALKSSGILISESARGEGGYLVNSKEERFIDELKPRDEVSRAIIKQIAKGEDIFLDIRHLGEEKLNELLPQEIKLCKLHENIDPAKELIPIKPVAHYTMGGIDVDNNLSINGLDGVFAVGECSNSHIHGANRLGGNSLLEVVSMGRLAGINAYNYSKSDDIIDKNSKQLEDDKIMIDNIYNYSNKINFYKIRDKIGEEFYLKGGVIRNRVDLEKLLRYINSIDIKDMGIGDKSRENNQNLVEFLEFINSLEIAKVILESALDREESIGAHYREY
ncbi:Succinate dehydrogenase flavoprotein subunit [hydrothermal vent metagenome]|uniref:Succinate dehydrogenase flavoprotein subunit n=1 Tax=hydrothermal vent metagenome TaxID=652676 RepID=A0A1W1EIR4_9ZZZZ